MKNEPGFVCIIADAYKLYENNIPFVVIIEDNTIKAYGVTREDWKAIEEDYAAYVKSGASKPVIALDQAFMDTAKQMGWVIIGEL